MLAFWKVMGITGPTIRARRSGNEGNGSQVGERWPVASGRPALTGVTRRSDSAAGDLKSRYRWYMNPTETVPAPGGTAVRRAWLLTGGIIVLCAALAKLLIHLYAGRNYGYFTD